MYVFYNSSNYEERNKQPSCSCANETKLTKSKTRRLS